MWAKLTFVHNPFDPSQRSTYDIEVPLAGLPAEDLLSQLPVIQDSVWTVAVNGSKLQRGQVIQPGSYIACCLAPEKDYLRVVANILLIAFIVWIGAGVLTGAAIYWAGSKLINSVLPAPTPDVPNIGSDPFTESPTYGWGRLQPTLGQGHPIPMLYGTHKVCGQVLSKAIIPSGNNQKLNVMMAIGLGPIDSITDIRVNDQPINHFKGITAHTRLGTPNDAYIPGFNEIPALSSVAVRLSTTYHTHQTSGDAVESIRMDLSFPYGLYTFFAKKGWTLPFSVSLYISYRLVGAANWTYHPIQTITAATYQPLRRTITLPDLPPGKYEVRVARVAPESDNNFTKDYCYWDTVTEVIKQRLIYPGIAKYAISALATDQLSGVEPVFTCLASRKQVKVYNPYIYGYEWRSATNPAWAAYDVLHNPENGNIPPSRIDFDGLLAFSEYCDELIGGKPRHTCNIYLDSPASIWAHYGAILQLGRAVPVKRGAVYSLVVDRPQPVSQLYTVASIVEDSFELSYLATGNRANALEVTYIDAERDYTRQTLAVYSVGYNQADTPDNKVSMRFFGCVNRSEVLREAAFRLNSTNWTVRTVSFIVDVDGLSSQAGDLIIFQHDAPDWAEGGRIVSATASGFKLDKKIDYDLQTGSYSVLIRLNNDQIVERVVTPVGDSPTDQFTVVQPFSEVPTKYDPCMIGQSATLKRIYRIVNIAKESDLTRKITAVEYVEAIYSDTGFIFEEPIWDPQLQVAVGVRSAEVVTMSGDGSYSTYVNVTWMPEFLSPNYDWAIWLEDVTGGTDAVKVGGTTDLHFIIASSLLSLGHTYKVYVVRADQGPLDFGQNTDTFLLAGELAPPSDVLAFTGAFNPTTRTVIFTWDEVEDLDLNHYEIRMGGVDWGTAEVVVDNATGTMAGYYIAAATQATVTFRIKAVDNSKSYSVNESTADVPIDTSVASVMAPTGLTLVTDSEIQPDGSEKVYIRATWDANAEVSDSFSHYDIVLKETASLWKIEDMATETEMLWYVPAALGYVVELRSADKIGGYSSWVSDTITSASDTTPPETVIWSTPPHDIVPGFKVMGLHWEKSTAADIAGYVIERATDAGFSDTAEIAQAQTNYFVDSGLAIDEEYFYRVKGIDRSGNRSISWSATKSATTLAVGSEDIAVGSVLAQHLSATEVYALIIESANYSEAAGLEAGFKLDAINNIAKFFDFTIDTANGSIIVRNLGSGDYAELTDGDLNFYYANGAGGYELYNSVRRMELGTAQNGVTTVLDGIWREKPKIIVAPANLQSYDASYPNNDQVLDVAAANIEEYPAGSGIWRFVPTASLALLSSVATATYPNTNLLSGAGATQVTPANTVKVRIRGTFSYQPRAIWYVTVNTWIKVTLRIVIGGTPFTIYSKKWVYPTPPYFWTSTQTVSVDGTFTKAGGTYNYYVDLIVEGYSSQLNAATFNSGKLTFTSGTGIIGAAGTLNFSAIGK